MRIGQIRSSGVETGQQKINAIADDELYNLIFDIGGRLN